MADLELPPKLFEGVLTEAKALQSRQHGIEEPLGTESTLLEFVEQAFDGVFRSELGIGVPDFTQTGKEEVLFLAEGKAAEPVVSTMLNLYVDVCNVWPDVLSQAYGGSATDFLEFRTELVPSLLSELSELATQRQSGELSERIKSAQITYKDALSAAARKADGPDR